MWIILIFMASCHEVEVMEKAANIPQHAWVKTQSAIVELDVKDSALYDLYILVRHSQKFPFTHLITLLSIQDTAGKQLGIMDLTLPLTKSDGYWSGVNIDDLYDHRIKINNPVFLKSGKLRFIFRHEMKENPLPFILNIGVAISKSKEQL